MLQLLKMIKMEFKWFDNGFDASKRFDNLTIQDSEYPNGILPISLAVDTASVDVLESLINNGAALSIT